MITAFLWTTRALALAPEIIREGYLGAGREGYLGAGREVVIVVVFIAVVVFLIVVVIIIFAWEGAVRFAYLILAESLVALHAAGMWFHVMTLNHPFLAARAIIWW